MRRDREDREYPYRLHDLFPLRRPRRAYLPQLPRHRRNLRGSLKVVFTFRGHTISARNIALDSQLYQVRHCAFISPWQLRIGDHSENLFRRDFASLQCLPIGRGNRLVTCLPPFNLQFAKRPLTIILCATLQLIGERTRGPWGGNHEGSQRCG